MAQPLEGRVALVTGGSRGIGAATAIALARDGADIALNYARDQAAAEATAAEIARLGRRVRIYRADVADPDACDALVDAVAADLGGLNILVNNAGLASRGGAVADTPFAELRRMMEVHAYGPFCLIRRALPHLTAGGRGDVVILSSVATKALVPNSSTYAMAKAAGEALAVTLAKEVQGLGVRVNAVAPGLTATDMGERLARATAGTADIHELDAQMPFGRVCAPQDIAEVIAYLCSPRNAYVSGQVIYVDGAYDGLPRPPR